MPVAKTQPMEWPTTAEQAAAEARSAERSAAVEAQLDTKGEQQTNPKKEWSENG